MPSSNKEIARRVIEVLNTCDSVDEAIATGVEDLWDPEIDARGASGAEAVGQLVGAVYTFRDGRILRIEWHNDVDQARAIFEQAE